MTAPNHFARDRRFWIPVLYAVPIGLMAGSLGLLFTSLVTAASNWLWPTDEVDYELFSGEPWWLVVTAGAGLLVGLLRRWLRVPTDPKGALECVEEQSVDKPSAAPMLLVSLISLCGGASLGPFDAGTRGGGGIGEWFSDRVGADDETRRLNTMAGMNGGVGGLLTSPFIATLFLTELSPPKQGDDHYRMLASSLVGSVFGFFVVFSIAGATFLEVFAVPGYDVEVWHFGIAVLLGVVAAFLSRLLGAAVVIGRRAATRITNTVVRAVVGGLAFGLVGLAFPITLGAGKDQLADLVTVTQELSAAVMIGVVLAKIVAVAISLSTGFIGGPVMPSLFIGGSAGIATHALFPDLPIALTLSCLLVAVPGASVKAPFAMALLAALTVGVGPIEASPAGVAVLTAFLLTTGVGLFDRLLPGKSGDPDDPDNVSYQQQLFDLSHGDAAP